MLFGFYNDFGVFSWKLMHSLGLLLPTEICLWWIQWKLYSRMLRTCCVGFTLTRMWRQSAKPWLLKRMHGIMWWRLGGVWLTVYVRVISMSTLKTLKWLALYDLCLWTMYAKHGWFHTTTNRYEYCFLYLWFVSD